MVPGVKIVLGESEYIVPPLSLGQLRRFKDEFKKVDDARKAATSLGDDQFFAVLDGSMPIILAALQRNYPSLTQEVLDNVIDIGNFQDVMQAVMAASGLKRVAPGENRPVPASTATNSGETSTV
jgi:hypothetical protein